MDYGLDIDGIIGYDFMKKVRLVIDLKAFYITKELKIFIILNHFCVIKNNKRKSRVNI